MKNALSGALDFLDQCASICNKARKGQWSSPPTGTHHLALEKWVVSKMKKVTKMCLAGAATKYGKKFNNEQQLLLHVSDMLIQVYAAESTVLRTEKLISQKGKEKYLNQLKLTELFVHRANSIIAAKGQEVILGFAEGDD
jgi:hypothetical protein